MNKLATKLKTINENYDDVNLGGCACIAAMIAESLRLVFPIMRITACNPSWSTAKQGDINEIRDMSNEAADKDYWYSNGLGFDHVWIEVWYKKRWYVLDSTGVHTRKEMYARWTEPHKGSFSIKEMKSMAAERTGWNDWFDRSQLPNIKQHIDNLQLGRV